MTGSDQGGDTPTRRLDGGPGGEADSAAESLKARLLGIPDRTLAPGTELGRFVLLAQIGAGGMGVVYAAYDPELDRKVAVKLVQTAKERGRGSSGRSRLLREAQAMARLAHPNVIAVYEVGTVGDQVFLAMEFVKGLTLAQWLQRGARGWQEVIAAFVQAGRGLAAAHRAGIVHRDFKPDNALIDGEGRVRVLDFGLALRRDDPPEREEPEGEAIAALRSRSGIRLAAATLGFTGTPAYMSPEQHAGAAGEAASDQYSFCVALYEALYGVRPFAGETLAALRPAVLRGVVQAPPAGSKVPPWLRQVLLRGLAVEPARRYPDMDALLADLTRDRRRTRRRVVLAVVVVAAGLGGWGLYRWALERGVAAAVAERDAACGGAAARLAGVWDEERRAAVDAGLRATGAPYAADTSERVLPRLDAYAAGWADAYAGACAAAQSREQGAAARLQCVEARRFELAALVEVLAQADAAAVEHAVAAAAGLTAPASCEDPEAQRLPPARDAAAAQATREALARARAQERAGRFAAGLELARAARARAEALGYRPLVAEAWLREGVLLDMSGDYPGAEAALVAAAWGAEAAGHDAAVVDAATELVLVVGSRRARYAEAGVWAGLAQAGLDRLGGRPGARQAALWGNLGGLRVGEGRYAEAKQVLTRALELSQAVLGAQDPELAQVHSDLGNALRMLGEYDAAVQHYEAARAIREQALGPAHPAVAMVLNNLAVVFAVRGDLPRAEADYRRAIAVWEAALGPEHPSLGHALTNLGSLLQSRGELQEAHALATRALAVWERAYGPDHPDLVSPLITLGNVQKDQGALDQAARTYQRALAISEAALGPEHPDVAYPLANLAEVALRQGRAAAARRDFARALALFERAGAADDLIAQLLVSLGRVELAERRFAEALPLLERALARLEPGAHGGRGDVALLLAQTHWALGAREHAAAAAELAVAELRTAGATARADEAAAWLRAHR